MQTTIQERIACARGELLNAMQKIETEQELPSCIMDGILSGILADLRETDKMELLNVNIALKQEHDEEIKKLSSELEEAKKAAKKVLPETEETEQENDTGKQETTPKKNK